MKVSLNNAVFEVQCGATVLDVAKCIDSSLSQKATAGIVNGNVRDLRYKVNEEGSHIEILTFDSNIEGKKAYWLTAALILAHAVKRVFPTAKIANGLAIENGFLYDFEVSNPFSVADKAKIEDEMRKIVKERLSIEMISLSKAEAIKLMQERDEPYKVELIEEIDEQEELSFYKQGDFIDLCKGPQLLSTGKVKAIKLLTTSSSYWKGDESNKRLQRIYGIAFPKASELEQYMLLIEEAKKRDHRKLGRELELFRFHETAPGMAYWLPNGWVLYNNLIDFWRAEHRKNGYLEFSAPQVNNSELWKTSGHWDH